MTPYILISTAYSDMISYGIAYAEYDAGRPILIETYPDLSFRKSQVIKLVEYCNSSNLDHYLLRQTVELFLSNL